MTEETIENEEATGEAKNLTEKMPKRVGGEQEMQAPERYFLLMLYSPLPNVMIDNTDVLVLLNEVEKVVSARDETTIDVLLNSTGGNIYSAYKMVNILRTKCKELRIVVPLYAKSAATLMALGADKVIMGPQSELGPLDLPMEHPTAEGIQISALDGVRPLEYLSAIAVNLAFDLGLRIRRSIQLGRRESIEIALKFAADCITPVISKLDPSLVALCYRELDIAARYAREFLTDYMFKDRLNREALAEGVATSIVWDYPSHGFAIGLREAKRLCLEILSSDEYDRWDDLWAIFMNIQKEELPRKIIHLLPEDDLVSILEKGLDDQEQLEEKEEKASLA